MEVVTIPKKEYQRLVERALRYEYLKKLIKEEEDIFSPPPRNIKEIIREFKEIGIYSPEFIKDLERGLKRSSYFQK